MTVSTFIQTDSTIQSLSQYFINLDGDVSVLARLATAFAPHATSPASLTVTVDPGTIFFNNNLTEIAAQATTAFTTPVSNPRIDRIVLNRQNGVISVVTGAEAASPVPPAILAGFSPIAQVRLTVGMASITNANITDERVNSTAGSTPGTLLNVQRFTASGTYTPTAGTSSVIVEVVGGGGSGGASAATTASQGAAAGGGSAGSFARALLTSGFAGAAVTVGAGGATTAAGANNGNAGATSSFGSTVSAPGGNGGYAGINFVPNAVVGGATSGAAPTGGNLVSSVGMPGGYGVVIATNSVIAGIGGSSVYGGGGIGGGNQAGGAAVSPGAGGGGASAINNTAARTGGAGANGIVTVYEYS